MDALSKMMASTRLQSSLLATLSLSAPWALDFQQGSGSPAHYLLEGEAWLEIGADRIHLTAGDLVMFPRWDRHVLTSTPGLPAVRIIDALERSGVRPWTPGETLDQPTRLMFGGAGARTEMLSMNFRLEAPERNPLLLGLPRLVHIRGDDARMTVWLQPVLQFINEEETSRRAGYAMVSSRLADLLFMQIVRAQLLLRPQEVSGWLRGLADPAIARALAAMHERPGARWTIAMLAREGGTSRSTFAARFREVMETTPLDYLTRLRMQNAAERLADGAAVKTLAGELGYATTFAFASAFKRCYGMAPGRFGRSRRAP